MYYSYKGKSFWRHLFLQNTSPWLLLKNLLQMSTMIDTLQGCNWKFFRAGDVSWTKGISINILSTTDKSQASQEKSSKVFLLDTLTAAFKARNLIHGWTESELFSQNQGNFFNFQKIFPLSTLVAPLHYHLFPLFTYQVSQLALNPGKLPTRVGIMSQIFHTQQLGITYLLFGAKYWYLQRVNWQYAAWR